MDFDRVERVLAAFERLRVRYVVFGGVALNFHGLARFTDDLDVFLEPEADNIRRLREALHAVFDDPTIDEISERDLLGEYPAVQYTSPDGSFRMDILTRLGEAFRYADVESERMPFGEMVISVATPSMLYRMKRNTVRLQDRADAQRLREQFKLEDD